MSDTEELRQRLEEDGKRNIDLGEIHELLDRLEAAESDALEQARLSGMGASREAALMAKLEAAEKERDALRIELNEIRYGVAVTHDTIKALRAKIEQMERHAPSMPDLIESLRCACNYIDNLGSVSQQYRAMLTSPEAKP